MLTRVIRRNFARGAPSSISGRDRTSPPKSALIFSCHRPRSSLHARTLPPSSLTVQFT